MLLIDRKTIHLASNDCSSIRLIWVWKTRHALKRHCSSYLIFEPVVDWQNHRYLHNNKEKNRFYANSRKHEPLHGAGPAVYLKCMYFLAEVFYTTRYNSSFSILNWYPRRSCCRDCAMNALPRKKKLRNKIGSYSLSFSCFRLLIFATCTFYYSFRKSKMRKKKSHILCLFQSHSCLVSISLTGNSTLCTERCSAADRHQPCAVARAALCSTTLLSISKDSPVMISKSKSLLFKMSFKISILWTFIFWIFSPVDLIAKK